MDYTATRKVILNWVVHSQVTQ